MSDRKDYLKKWRQENKEHIRNYKKEYAKTHDSSFKKLQDKYKQLQQENQELKEQLEENQNPLKGIFAQVNDDTLLRDCGNMNAEINELKNQQKEFINYLEDMLDGENDIFSVVRVKDVLQKYREIIGGNDV